MYVRCSGIHVNVDTRSSEPGEEEGVAWNLLTQAYEGWKISSAGLKMYEKV
jgi:hypothetical protein